MLQKIIIFFICFFSLSNMLVFADTVTTAEDTTTLGIDQEKARTGDFNYKDIPKIIVSATEWLLAFSGTISIVVIIYGALRMQLGSGVLGKEDVGKGKGAITAGITGFIISALSWLIVYGIVTLISQASSG